MEAALKFPVARQANGARRGEVHVLKFGSSVLAHPEDYRIVAEAIGAEVARGHKVVAVVSAMGETTDSLLAAARSVAPASIRFAENHDYYLLRYLSGGALGLRDLSRNFGSVIRFSSTGQTTGLELGSLDDLTLMVVIAERAEAIRNWAEQVATETETKMIAATGYAAQPLSQPYVDGSDKIIGLIVGIRDVYTYGEKLQAIYAEFTPDPGRVVEQPTATPTPTPTATLLPTETATATPTSTATEIEPVVEPLGAQPATELPIATPAVVVASETAPPPTVEPPNATSPVPCFLSFASLRVGSLPPEVV
jgi:hypothetical protein